MLSLWCSVTRIPSPSLSIPTTELTPLKTTSVLLSLYKDIYANSQYAMVLRMRLDHEGFLREKLGVSCMLCIYTTRAAGQNGGLPSSPSTATPEVNSVVWQTSSWEERVLRAPDEGGNVSIHRSFRKH